MNPNDFLSAVDAAKNAGKNAGRTIGAETATVARGAKTRTLDLVHGALDWIGVLRRLGTEDILSTIGLGRKRSNPMVAAGSFGAGLAIGAGLGVLFAPRSGSETRAALRARAESTFSPKKEEPSEPSPGMRAVSVGTSTKLHNEHN